MTECFDDDYIWEKDFKKLNKQHIQIPSLHMIARATLNRASAPLSEHYHKNRLEFVTIINGHQQYSVNGHNYHLFGQDVFTTFPDEPHGNNNSHQAVCEFIWFQIDMTKCSNFLGLSPPLSDILYQKLSCYKKRTNKVGNSELLLLMQSFDYFCSEDPAWKLLGHSLFLSFLTRLTLTENISQDISCDIQKAIDFIKENITEYINFSSISEVCNLSVSRLKTKFKEQMGITPREYINSLKVEYAKNMLLDENYNITDVAFDLNFSSSNYFSSVFKQFTGFTPSQYRDLISHGSAADGSFHEPA
ncbi:AraC family transcriptional regulator [Robinsoniella peoriensis]|uniref:AraC family transcriptional regulator n=1 Tax=Robinsoniella peoriensis TaxID=180332 RepID=UPI0037517F45